ncbi:MAG: Fic family protein, partial [Ardenticatenaceae bacterium]
LDYIAAHPGTGREDIRKAVAPEASGPTVWRALKRLTDEGKLSVSGKGRATGYTIAGSQEVRAYLKTPYNRRPPKAYNKEFLDSYVPDKTFYLSTPNRERLHEAGRPTIPPLPAGTYARRILEKLLVDLAWASSRMEGNTYDILQTEELVRFGKEATGKDRKEAVMILNHKEAIQYVVDNIGEIGINRRDICNIHALLSDGLLIDPAMAGRLRRMPAGISHSSYTPPGDEFVIEEEFQIIVDKAAAISDPFEQSFFLLVHIPYLQAFADVNKRTSRIASNIPLLKADLAPMSFVTMDDKAYIDGLIGIYELNNVSLLREIYIDAYLASAENYKILRAEVDSPEKAAVAYRDFVKDAVRRSVLEHKAFHAEKVMAMATEAGIPEVDREQVVSYVGAQFKGLHDGNAIRFRLKPEEVADIVRQ